CEPPVRQLGPVSFFPLAGALGYALAFVVDESREVRISRATKRKPGGPRGTDWRSARALAVIRKWGSEGGLKRFANMTVEEMKSHQSRAGKHRAKKAKKQRKISGAPARSADRDRRTRRNKG